MTPSECFINEILNCGTADICMLEEIYSPLADEVMYDGWVKEYIVVYPDTDLNTLLYTLYRNVRDQIKEELEEIIKEAESCDNKELIELINENMFHLEREPYPNCFDTHFDSDLDQVIDWKDSVQANAENLISYWEDTNE
jgi:hypothetical protein